MKGGGNMPNRDGTGPEGKGPKTGRGMGNCSGDKKESTRGVGRGMGRGVGRRSQNTK